MPRYVLTVQYLGTRYAGWQMQNNALSVQEVIERALRRMFGMDIRIEGAGRTDAGVHALAQVAHADLSVPISDRGLLLGLNDLLPPDIRIRAVRAATPTFHARFDARGKTYLYQIVNVPVADVFLSPTHAHIRQPLDDGLMDRAAASLTGGHDFRAFTVRNPEVSSTVRTVRAVGVEREGEIVRIRIAADGFLRFMVRRIAGSLIEIGRGVQPARIMEEALEPQFGVARWTAPAEGLTLVSVDYDEIETAPILPGWQGHAGTGVEPRK
ncbi:MAG: tRNA pseudouridine(38-40) synthase TruA [Acidobacteriota bacterium]